jgi:hypothetical protein
MRTTSQTTHAVVEQYTIVEHLQPENLQGRYGLVGIGGYGTKEALRTARQALAFGVGAEIALVILLEFDAPQLQVALKNVPPQLPVLYPTEAVPGKSVLPEGFGRRSPEEVWGLRGYWMPVIDEVLDRAKRLLLRNEIYPSMFGTFWSSGGHALLAPYVQWRLAQEWPLAGRFCASAAPADPASRREYARVLDTFMPA